MLAPQDNDRGLRSYSSVCAAPSGSGSRGARIHTSCAVVVAPTFDRAFARWCFTVECDRPRRWAAAFSDPAMRIVHLGHALGLWQPRRQDPRQLRRRLGSHLGPSVRQVVLLRPAIAGRRYRCCQLPRRRPQAQARAMNPGG